MSCFISIGRCTSLAPIQFYVRHRRRHCHRLTWRHTRTMVLHGLVRAHTDKIDFVCRFSSEFIFVFISIFDVSIRRPVVRNRFTAELGLALTWHQSKAKQNIFASLPSPPPSCSRWKHISLILIDCVYTAFSWREIAFFVFISVCTGWLASTLASCEAVKRAKWFYTKCRLIDCVCVCWRWVCVWQKVRFIRLINYLIKIMGPSTGNPNIDWMPKQNKRNRSCMTNAMITILRSFIVIVSHFHFYFTWLDSDESQTHFAPFAFSCDSMIVVVLDCCGRSVTIKHLQLDIHLPSHHFLV